MRTVFTMQKENIPLISVIVPVYNVKDYLNKCIESLVNQIYTNLEILLIDDGSTDGSDIICDQWEMKDERIRVFHTLNKGVSHARNYGLCQAKGKYIGFVDADDWIEPDMYIKMVTALNETEAEICIGEYTNDVKNKKIINFDKGQARIFTRDEVIVRTYTWFPSTQKRLISWELCDKLFLHAVLENVKLHEDIYMGEDMVFYWDALKNSNKIVYLPLFKYHYKLRENSAVHSGITEKSLTGFYAKQIIYNEACHESKEIYLAVKKMYIIDGVYYMRKMLSYDSNKFKNVIIKYQCFLRKNIYEAIKIRKTSIRVKLGMVFLCFPFPICQILHKLVVK